MSRRTLPRVSFFERNAWKVFVAVGVIVALFGLGDVGVDDTEPVARSGGAALLWRAVASC